MRSNEIIVGVGERISISFRKRKHARYLAEEADDGTITLIPAALVPAYKVLPDDLISAAEGKITGPGELKDMLRELAAPGWGVSRHA
jgi:hypothetical protein